MGSASPSLSVRFLFAPWILSSKPVELVRQGKLTGNLLGIQVSLALPIGWLGCAGSRRIVSYNESWAPPRRQPICVRTWTCHK